MRTVLYRVALIGADNAEGRMTSGLIGRNMEVMESHSFEPRKVSEIGTPVGCIYSRSLMASHGVLPIQYRFLHPPILVMRTGQLMCVTSSWVLRQLRIRSSQRTDVQLSQHRPNMAPSLTKALKAFIQTVPWANSKISRRLPVRSIMTTTSAWIYNG